MNIIVDRKVGKNRSFEGVLSTLVVFNGLMLVWTIHVLVLQSYNNPFAPPSKTGIKSTHQFGNMIEVTETETLVADRRSRS